MCIVEVKKRVLEKNREQVAKILHNGNISTQDLSEYEKCILEIANFFDKCKNVDKVEAARMSVWKDSRYERCDEAAQILWNKVDAETSPQERDLQRTNVVFE